MTNDLILLIVGVILGFGSSIGTLKYQEHNQRKKALDLLKIEVFKINKLITPFTIKDNKMISPIDGKSTNFTGISISEIPNFKIIIQIDLLLSLEDYFRESIYSISVDLESAEKHRLLAIPLLNQLYEEKELYIYGAIYFDYLTSAKEKIDKLIDRLK